jgi:hypothetical protein
MPRRKRSVIEKTQMLEGRGSLRGVLRTTKNTNRVPRTKRKECIQA